MGLAPAVTVVPGQGSANRLKCLVTGSTGFVGRAVCRALGEAGHELICPVRGQAEAPGRGPAPMLDLARPLPASFSLSGVDVVVHAAGIAHQQAPAALHTAVNEQATIALAHRAARDGVDRFIFLSSVKAMGPGGGTAPRPETELCEPVGPYALSKRRAELALAQLAASSPLRIVSLRPALVYGPGVAGNLARLIAWVRRGLPMLPDAGARSMVSCADLAGLIAWLADCETQLLPVEGAVWNVTDGESYTTRRLMLAIADALDRPVPGLVVPAAGWRALGAGVDVLKRRPLGSTARALLAHELFDNAALCAATGWRPRERFEEAAPAIVRAAT